MCRDDARGPGSRQDIRSGRGAISLLKSGGKHDFFGNDPRPQSPPLRNRPVPSKDQPERGLGMLSYFLVVLTIAFTVYGQIVIKWQVLQAGALPLNSGKLWFVL